MTKETFEAKYTPSSISEKDKVVLNNEGYALGEAIYSLVESIEKLRLAIHG